MMTKKFFKSKELSALLTSLPLPKEEKEERGEETVSHSSSSPSLSASSSPSSSRDLNNNNIRSNSVSSKSISPTAICSTANCSKYGSSREYSLPPMEAAVRIKDGRHSYGSGSNAIHVLNGINMTVPVGCIYGLLGPSGCGKTTLLRCMIGCLKLNSGTIKIFSHSPGSPGSGIPGSGCGYMPQEVALDDDLTIEETLTYYARLHNLNYKDIKMRIDHLVDFLDLPRSSKSNLEDSGSLLVGSLSGGQKRRVSFAAALIHKPRLIILDEPTVGVDPILRERIWQALIQITEVDKTTVIITTHYIEETRRAHSVAFMRRGVLLVEDSPASLIRKYQSSSLEDVFYKLSLLQKKQTQLIKQTLQKEQIKGIKYVRRRSSAAASTSGQVFNGNIPVDLSPSPLNSFDSTISGIMAPYHVQESPWQVIESWLVRYQALTAKILIQQLRQSNLMFLQFILPLISLFLFCTCVGHTPKNVQLMLVNDESPVYLSRLFLNNINSEIIRVTMSPNITHATRVVKAREAWGLVHIPEDFSRSLIARSTFQDSENEISNDTISKSTITIYADLTNKVLSVTMQRTLEAAFEAFTKDALIELDYNPKLLQYPIIIGDVIYGQVSSSDYFAIRDYGIPGLLVILTYSCAFASTVLILNGESADQKDDFMDRNFVSGVTTVHLLISYLTSRLFAMVINAVTLLIVAIYFFEAPAKGSITVSIFLLILQSIAGLTHGLLISSISKSFFMAMVLSNFVLLGMFIISGVLWPLSSLPTWLRYISYAQPTTIPTESLRNLLSKGITATSMSVLSGFAISIVYIVVFFILSILLFRSNFGLFM